jgi:hypothetical protein
MKSDSLKSRFLGCTSAASLLQFTLVFPLLAIVLLGSVDFIFYMFNRDLAAKATQKGARLAIVTNPVATGIADPYVGDGTRLGSICYNTATGAKDTSVCGPLRSSICQPAASSGTCSGGFAFDDAAFAAVFNEMRTFLPVLQRQHVKIEYEDTGLGFVGRPGGVPMTVTVKLRCLTHRFFFINALMGWAFSGPGVTCPAGPAGPLIPEFAASLPTEDMKN